MSPWPSHRMLADDLALFVDQVSESQEPLLAPELPLTQGMTAGRLKEFRAGRSVGRRALQMLGEKPGTLLQGSEGEPIWPDGIVGSLSHTSLLAASIVSHRKTFRSVGVDLNDVREIGDAAATDLMSDREVATARALFLNADLESGRNLVFSAKEALFKCQFTLTRCSNLDFNEVVLSDAAGQGFLTATVVMRPDLEAIIHGIQIIPMIIQGHILVAALLA